MNRRNVLGNRIEESKTIWVVLTGLVVTALICVIFHFLGEGFIGMLMAGVLLLVGSLVVHFITGEQGELFPYLLLPCVLCGAIGLLIPHLSGYILPGSKAMLLASLFAWLIPVVYAVIFTWVEGISVAGEFADFYLKSIWFFYIVYFVAIIYDLFFRPYVVLDEPTAQLIPFATFAAVVNGLLQDTVTVAELIGYIMNRLLLILPYGFLIAMVGRRMMGVLRILLLPVLPIVMELVQFITRRGACDADDVVFGFLGGLIGMLCFMGFNYVFQNVVGRNFDGTEVVRDYYGRKL